MHRIRSLALRLAVVAPAWLAGTACSSTAGTQPDGAPPAAPATHAATTVAPTFLAGSALVVHSAGFEAMLADPRDAGLRHALALVDARLAELPDELPGFHAPPGALELAFDLLTAPFTLRVDLQGGATSGPLAPDLQWTVRTQSAEQTRALAERFAALLVQHGLPSKPVADRPELASVATPLGNLFFGSIDGGATFHVSLGEPRTATPESGTFGLPAGDEPLFAFGLDMARLQEPMKLGFALAGPKSLPLQEQCEAMGLFGADALALAFTAGRAADRAHVAGLYHNWLPILEGMGLEAPAPLTESVLRVVPGDATLVSLQSFDAHSIPAVFEQLGPDGAEARAHIEALLGVDLTADVVEPLGTSSGFYLSDTTGGGGLASGVFFVAVADEARCAHTLAALAEHLDELARERLHGRVRTRTFEHGGTQCLTVDCVGIPAPLQLSLALASGFLFVTATPQALVAALDHARAGGAGLSARPDVAALGIGGRQDVQGFFFCDAPRLLNTGYGYSAALAAMLANALRSPTDPTREPGFVLPSYRELLAGARPTLVLSCLQGDDLVFEGECDPSAAAHVTSLLGWVPSFVSGIPLLGLLTTLVVPQVVQSLAVAKGAKARAEIAMLDHALANYAVENMGRYPASLEALVKPDEDGNTFLDAEELPLDPWGNPYVYDLVVGRPRVMSLGADGVPGGEGEDADVTSDRDEDEDQ